MTKLAGAYVFLADETSKISSTVFCLFAFILRQSFLFCQTIFKIKNIYKINILLYTESS